MSANDVVYMSRTGLSDEDIRDVILIASYFSFCNRVAEGVGLETEDTRKEWLSRLLATREQADSQGVFERPEHEREASTGPQ
jgi:hypothetical protein